jgi:hypothetical protein
VGPGRDCAHSEGIERLSICIFALKPKLRIEDGVECCENACLVSGTSEMALRDIEGIVKEPTNHVHAKPPDSLHVSEAIV